MAKKSKKGNKKAQANPADALRDAVERTFQGAAGGASGAQKRVQDVFDDFGTALVRLRETVDERRVIDTLESLRDEVANLGKRVSDLEGSGQSRASAAATSATEAARNVASTAAKPTSATPKRKPATATAKRKPAAGRPKASSSGSTKTGGKPSTRKPASTRKSSSASKPTSTRKSSSASKPPSTRKAASTRKPASGATGTGSS